MGFIRKCTLLTLFTLGLTGCTFFETEEEAYSRFLAYLDTAVCDTGAENKWLTDCLAHPNAYSTPDIGHCAKAQLDVCRPEMDRVFKEAQKRALKYFDKKELVKLNKSQKMWNDFTWFNCKIGRDFTGTLDYELYPVCLAEETAKRVKELDSYYRDEERYAGDNTDSTADED